VPHPVPILLTSDTPKQATEALLEWQPKDHECRTIPIPEETIQLLANFQSECDEGNPYVLIPTKRWEHILMRRSRDTWQPDKEIINNLTHSLRVICQRAEIEYFTPHDLRRSCITNWAKKLSIHTVQSLAGHSDINTTRKYYLSVQDSDMKAARRIQSKLMAN